MTNEQDQDFDSIWEIVDKRLYGKPGEYFCLLEDLKMSTSSRRISTLTIVFMAVVLFANSAVVHGADWPIYRGPQHNGITSEQTGLVV